MKDPNFEITIKSSSFDYETKVLTEKEMQTFNIGIKECLNGKRGFVEFMNWENEMNIVSRKILMKSKIAVKEI